MRCNGVERVFGEIRRVGPLKSCVLDLSSALPSIPTTLAQLHNYLCGPFKALQAGELAYLPRTVITLTCQ